MIDSVTVSAPCKINLHLRVLGRRSDGFHDIESVFQLVSVADRLSVSIVPDRGSCEFVCPAMELPAANTVTKALALFRALTGVDAGVRMELDKRVPSGAGLGGGSSDAAAALVALDRLFGTGLGRDGLLPLACKIGSDVPFFLSDPAAVVLGRGERVLPIPARDDLFGVLVWPDAHCPTPAAYGLVDAWRERFPGTDRDWPAVGDLGRLYRGDPGTWPFGNSFTAPVAEAFPIVGEALRDVRGTNPAFAEMSGSGSAVFGIYEDETSADSARICLSARWKTCLKFLLLASSPMR